MLAVYETVMRERASVSLTEIGCEIPANTGARASRGPARAAR
jgi:hypothetical protein